MGIVSGAALGAGGEVVGVIPHVMLASGGEGERVPGNGCSSVFVKLGEEGREMVSVTGLYDTHKLNSISDGMGAMTSRTH